MESGGCATNVFRRPKSCSLTQAKRRRGSVCVVRLLSRLLIRRRGRADPPSSSSTQQGAAGTSGNPPQRPIFIKWISNPLNECVPLKAWVKKPMERRANPWVALILVVATATIGKDDNELTLSVHMLSRSRRRVANLRSFLPLGDLLENDGLIVRPGAVRCRAIRRR